MDDRYFPGGAGEVVERDRLGRYFGWSHVELKSVKGKWDIVAPLGLSGFDCVSFISQRWNVIRGLVYGLYRRGFNVNIILSTLPCWTLRQFILTSSALTWSSFTRCVRFLGRGRGPRPPSRSRPHGADCIDAFDADASSQIGKNIQCLQLKSSKLILNKWNILYDSQPSPTLRGLLML